MQSLGYPVVLDVTHSMQQPTQESGGTGGKPELITAMAKAGIAVGADGLFLETHPDPNNAKSDGANMLNLNIMNTHVANITPMLNRHIHSAWCRKVKTEWIMETKICPHSNSWHLFF